MREEENLFAAARKASGMSQATAASICDISAASFGAREKSPGEFRLKELMALHKKLGASSREILKSAIDSLFLPM